jgi:hypothetical protein
MRREESLAEKWLEIELRKQVLQEEVERLLEEGDKRSLR